MGPVPVPEPAEGPGCQKFSGLSHVLINYIKATPIPPQAREAQPRNTMQIMQHTPKGVLSSELQFRPPYGRQILRDDTQGITKPAIHRLWGDPQCPQGVALALAAPRFCFRRGWQASKRIGVVVRWKQFFKSGAKQLASKFNDQRRLWAMYCACFGVTPTQADVAYQPAAILNKINKPYNMITPLHT